MAIAAFYKKLGAPLKNQTWSWGSVRESDQVVFLSVWQDRKFVQDGVPVMMVTNYQKYGDDSGNLGYEQRVKHVELVRQGATCYMIMCKVKDPNATPRSIESFNAKELFRAGEIIEKDGSFYFKVAKRVSITEIVPST